MLVNFVIACVISVATKAPPVEVQEMVDRVRYPRKALEKQDY